MYMKTYHETEVMLSANKREQSKNYRFVEDSNKTLAPLDMQFLSVQKLSRSYTFHKEEYCK